MEKLSAKKNKWQKPSLSLRDISPRGRDKFGLCVRGRDAFAWCVTNTSLPKEH